MILHIIYRVKKKNNNLWTSIIILAFFCISAIVIFDPFSLIAITNDRVMINCLVQTSCLFFRDHVIDDVIKIKKILF